LIYREELTKAMAMLSENPLTVFIGQAVARPGTAMSTTLAAVPLAQRLELPVMEEAQLGMATGMALAGWLPVCLYPRWNFLLLATNQLVNHLDKLPLYSAYRPRVIIRTAVATPEPLDPGPQHLGDFTNAFKSMLSTIEVVRLNRAKDIVDSYHAAMTAAGSTLLVEYTGRYDDEG